MNDLEGVLKKMRKTQPIIASLKPATRRALLRELGRALRQHTDEILRANEKDAGLLAEGSVMRERLMLSRRRVEDLARSVFAVAQLPEVLGQIVEVRTPPNGLAIKRITVPLGVIGVIYESRPNVTIDLIALSFKSGNALILKGGSESFRTNRVLVEIAHQVLKKFRLPKESVYLVDPAAEWKKALFSLHDLVDVLIPRGAAGLINYVRRHARVPVIETGAGVCHTFVDEQFDVERAIRIIVNAKTQRPGVCNSLDTLVIHRLALQKLLPDLGVQLARFGVEVLADAPSYAVMRKFYPPGLLKRSRAQDYGKEFLDLRMSVKTVRDFAKGLDFVKGHTSHHSEAVISRNRQHVNLFLREIDAAAVYDNISTRFTDGAEFGMGAEVGISTQKLHARGPMGANALTSYKWLVSGKTFVRS